MNLEELTEQTIHFSASMPDRSQRGSASREIDSACGSQRKPAKAAKRKQLLGSPNRRHCSLHLSR